MASVPVAGRGHLQRLSAFERVEQRLEGYTCSTEDRSPPGMSGSLMVTSLVDATTTVHLASLCSRSLDSRAIF